MIRLAVRKVVATPSFRTRMASVPDLTPAVLAAFAESLASRQNGRVLLAGLPSKLKKLIELLKQAPQMWARFKDMLGVQDITELPGLLKKWVKEGLAALKRVFLQISRAFPLALFFVVPKVMPSLSDLIKRIAGKNATLGAAFAKIQAGALRVDAFFGKYIPTLKRPLLAVIFAYLWWNVAELSFDLPSTVAGFLGGVTLGDMFSDLPEWGLSFIAGACGFAYEALPLVLIARLIWLVSNRYLEWVPGKGFKVYWDRIAGQQEEVVGPAVEIVPVFA